MKFGENLYHLRKDAKMSQEVLAEKVGVSRQSVSKWENGEAYPEMDNLLKICKIFHCKLNDIIHDDIQDIDSLDEDVKMSIVKFEKEKQKSVLETQRKAQTAARQTNDLLAVGDKVCIKGLTSVGVIDSIEGDMCTVIFGDMRTKLRLSRLDRVDPKKSSPTANGDGSPRKSKTDELKENLRANMVSHITQTTIDQRRQSFHQDIDVRGMRGDEALNAVQYFIDDAILMGVSRVRILHGKGNGILRQLIRQYLSTIPNVTHFKDEHVQFGGAGITVVDLE